MATEPTVQKRDRCRHCRWPLRIPQRPIADLTDEEYEMYLKHLRCPD